MMRWLLTKGMVAICYIFKETILCTLSRVLVLCTMTLEHFIFFPGSSPEKKIWLPHSLHPYTKQEGSQLPRSCFCLLPIATPISGAPTHGEICSVFCNNPHGEKRMVMYIRYMYLYTYISDSLCCVPDTNTTLSVNYISIKKLK